VLAITLLPYVWGALTCPPNQRFLGLIGEYGNDQAFYLGWGARQAQSGHILFEDKYNGATDRRLVFNTLWLAMGWAARCTGASIFTVFHVERVVFAALLLVLAERMAARFIESGPWRCAAVLLVAASSGFGALLPQAWGLDTPDLWIVESNVFLTMLGEVVLPAATALLLLTLHSAHATFVANAGSAVRTGLLTALLGTVYPYAVISMYCILAGVAVWRMLEGQPIGQTARAYATIVCLSLPVVVYDGYLVLTDPKLTTGQALYASPNPLAYLLGLGVVAFLAVPAALKAARDGGPDRFLVVWAGVTLVQIYLPRWLVPFQMQLILGIQVPLAILGARSLAALWTRVAQRSSRHRLGMAAAIAAVLALSLTTSIHHLRGVFERLERHTLPEYLDRDVEVAIQWLAAHAAEQAVVVSATQIAPFIPVLADTRMYTGDYEAPTADFARKRALVERALGGMGADGRTALEFLRAERIDYVFYDRDLERVVGSAARSRMRAGAGFAVVYDTPAVTIFEVMD
jgi:hypothetical protein